MEPSLFKTNPFKRYFGYIEIFHTLLFYEFRESDVMSLVVAGVVTTI